MNVKPLSIALAMAAALALGACSEQTEQEARETGASLDNAAAQGGDNAAVDLHPAGGVLGQPAVERQQPGVGEKDRAPSGFRIAHCSGTGTSLAWSPGASGWVSGPLAVRCPVGDSHWY